MNNKNLFALLHITDPSLPIGSFSHSSGLETFVQKGIVHNITSAKEFILEMLSNSIKYSDAALVALAYKAAVDNDLEKLIELDQLCSAIKIPMEIRSGSAKLGTRFSKIFCDHAGSRLSNEFGQLIISKEVAGHYCICFGLYSQILGIDIKESLTGFYYNALAGFVNNCVKLIPLGQQQGQQIIFEMENHVEQLVLETLEIDEMQIGRSSPGFDIGSMQHEQLYSRLYMS